ncbi:MAG TPA: hypothetical protein VFS67_30190 [Polyangiaceae bacterium]|nr:hypothetical protein [Polyangiaceae bacterium]
MGPFTTPKAARLLLLLCLLVGVALCWFHQPPPGAEAAVQNAPYVVGGPEVREVRVVTNGWGDNVTLSEPLQLDPKLEQGQVVAQRVRLAMDTKLRIFRAQGAFVDREVVTYSPFLLYGFIAVFALVVLLLPYAMSRDSEQKLGPWYQLLSEPHGGYSLARIQLLLWSLPVAVLYSALSAADRSFLSIDTQLQLLLGTSGITTFLSTAASPPSEGATISSAALSDMVTDWDGHGDVSRYQYLVLSLLGSLVLVVSFLQKLDFPDVPAELLYLVGGSQITYIATKAVKQAKSSAPASGTSTPGPTPVTTAPSALMALAAAPEGHVVEAPAEVATVDGSVRLPG